MIGSGEPHEGLYGQNLPYKFLKKFVRVGAVPFFLQWFAPTQWYCTPPSLPLKIAGLTVLGRLIENQKPAVRPTPFSPNKIAGFGLVIDLIHVL